MTNDLLSGRSKAPDFEHWESPETRVRWERGLAIVAGMIGVPLVFFFLVSVLPLSPDRDSRLSTGLQPTPAAQTEADTQAEAAAAPQPTAAPSQPTQALADGRLGAVSRAFPNVRRGPSLDSAVVANLRQGQRVDVVGRSGDNQWLQIINPDNTRDRLWVSADMLDVTGDARTLPVVRPE